MWRSADVCSSLSTNEKAKAHLSHVEVAVHRPHVLDHHLQLLVLEHSSDLRLRLGKHLRGSPSPALHCPCVDPPSRGPSRTSPARSRPPGPSLPARREPGDGVSDAQTDDVVAGGNEGVTQLAHERDVTAAEHRSVREEPARYFSLAESSSFLSLSLSHRNGIARASSGLSPVLDFPKRTCTTLRWREQ